MLDAGGGGGYGGTNWSSASVIDMWLAVGNQETTPHWELLTGWRKSYELTQQHMAAVKNYRENLATAWPPEKSAASAAYIERLDGLIEHLQHTYDAAVANYGAFSSATLALSSARNDLEKVVDEYLANQGKLAAFEKEQAEKPATGGLMRRPALSPPVADGRQAQLEAQARTIMFGLSAEVIQARAQIAQPPEYVPGLVVDDDTTDFGGTGHTPPPIPPIVPITPGSDTSGSAAGFSHGPASSHGNQAPNATPNTPRPPGLVLGGADVVTPPPPTALTPSHAPVVGGTPNPPVVPTGPFTGVPVGPSPSPFSSTPGRGHSAIPGQPMKAMPPGGIIGTTPTMGLGQPGSGSRPMSSVNPVGGLLNPNNPSGTRGPVGRAQPAGAHPFGTMGARCASDNDDHENTKRWDPDNPWETAKGVDPIVRPPAEQRVDPGPAIGLT
jgi:hypothetical protein